MGDQHDPSEDQLPGFLQEWAETNRDVLVDLTAMDADAAWRVAREAALRFAEAHKGEAPYVNFGLSVRLDARDRLILAEFNGRNYHAVAKHHGVTERHVRRLVKRALAVEVSSRQGDVFGDKPVIPNRR